MRLAIIAHDDMKDEAERWAVANTLALERHELFGTGTTGGRIAGATGLSVTRMLSGPYGGDQQIGALIAEGGIDALVFFIDSLSPHPHDVDVKALIRITPPRAGRRSRPHDVDVKALIRITTLKGIPLALNAAIADAVLAAIGR